MTVWCTYVGLEDYDGPDTQTLTEWVNTPVVGQRIGVGSGRYFVIYKVTNDENPWAPGTEIVHAWLKEEGT